MSQPAKVTLSDRTTRNVREALAGRGSALRTAIAVSGPAVIASVAYMDPGNFATNIQAGSAYGYSLLWVVVVANLIAMLFQAMSAKLGIVTNHNLAELSRLHFPRWVAIGMWVVSEVAAMATDLAEFLGGALGLSLLLHIPLLWGMGITGVVTYVLLSLERHGFRPIELVIGGLVLTIGLCYVLELLIAPPEWGAAALGSVVPHLPDNEAVMLSVGIVGATVMPHALYLHSALTQYRAPARTDTERRQLLRFSNREVVVALTFAGIVNVAMVMMAASAFHTGHSGVAEIATAYHTLVPLLGGAAAAAFLISLMASGISSSTVGTMAGQIIMQGFVGFRIPLWVRRLVTMVPPFFVVAMGYNATMSLVLSQVVLSLVLPVPVLAMLILSRRRSVMGEFVTGRLTAIAAGAATVVVLALNVILISQTFGVPVPGL